MKFFFNKPYLTGKETYYIAEAVKSGKFQAMGCLRKNIKLFLNKNILENKISSVAVAKKWFEIVVGNQPTEASENIWKAIDQCK